MERQVQATLFDPSLLDAGGAAVYSPENMTGHAPREYLSAAQAAGILGYTVQHTRLLFREGTIAAAKWGRDWFAPRSAVDEYLRRYRDTQQAPHEHARGSIGEGDEATVSTEIILTGVNVAQVPQRSPFRYPGGKTWLVPQVRLWLSSIDQPQVRLLEPFAGGGIVSLTAVFEDLVSHATMVELDDDVASVWQSTLNGDGSWLADQIARIDLDRHTMAEVMANRDRSRAHQALATIVHNRAARGGIMAPGAGVVKRGEGGKGIGSRWYPKTLRDRISAIAEHRSRLAFVQGDGLEALARVVNDPATACFIDPPYTVAGRRLYKHSDIDHERLFDIVAELRGDFLMTYDNTAHIRTLAERHGLPTRLIAMKTTHHRQKCELLVANHFDWLRH